MKTSQQTNRFSLAAVLVVAAGVLTSAFWSSQSTIVEIPVIKRSNAVIDGAIPSITITAKRISKTENQRIAENEIDPSIPHLTVIGYRDRTFAAVVAPL